MKRSIVFLALLLMVPFAYASSSDVASFTPPEMSGAHWLKLGDSQTEAYWYSHSIQRIGCIGTGKVDNRCATVNVALKGATKALGAGYSALSILRGTVICNSYALPQELFDAILSTVSVHSVPMRELTSDYAARQITLQRGTALADAVIRTCKAVNLALSKTGLPATSPMSSLTHRGPTPASGKCSIPSPDYPVNAMRQGKQGVATVAFDVSLDGHTSDRSILSSSGSPDLDKAALAAVALGTCNVAAGTRLSTPITFSLHGSM
jgi:TonB family protein